MFANITKHVDDAQENETISIITLYTYTHHQRIHSATKNGQSLRAFDRGKGKNLLLKRYSEIDLALLHLGGTRIFGVMLTMDGKQGVEALKIVAPDTAIPIHFNDYTVFKSPLEDFKKAVAAAGLTDKVRYLKHGETYTFEVPNVSA